MSSKHRKPARVVIIVLLCLGLSACAGMSRRDRYAITGATVGGVLGSALTSGSTAGTVGGAVLGGVLGSEAAKKR